MNQQTIRPQSLGIEISVILPKSFKKPLINPISWSMFQQVSSPPLPYSAHVYWHIQYFISFINQKPYVTCKIRIQNKSWVKPDNKNIQLLKHQYGHYLVGCLCAHQFLRKVNKKNKRQQMTIQKYREFVHATFNKVLQKYKNMEIQYDNQTEHYFNHEKQQQWNKKIVERLNQFSVIKPNNVVQNNNNNEQSKKESFKVFTSNRINLNLIQYTRQNSIKKKMISKSQNKLPSIQKPNRSISKDKSFKC